MRPGGCRLWFTRRLWIPLVCLLLLSGSSLVGRPAHAESSVGGTLAPGSPSVLMINQELPKWPAASELTGQQVEMMLKHFTPNVTRVNAAQYEDGQLSDFDRVVVVGNDAVRPLPPVLLEDLARADGQQILWLGHGLDRLPVDATQTFGFTVGEVARDESLVWVDYRGRRYSAELSSEIYHHVEIQSPTARALATYGGGREAIPYIVQGRNLWYVNGLPELVKDPSNLEVNVPPLVFADALHDFFGTSVTESQQALIRLEDVSVHIDPERIIETADYLYSQRIPFSIGVIPAQQLEDGSVVSLRERPEFVRALRYAQDRGGTIILHGYHHTFGSGEDYEYWDEKRDAPLRGESWEMYAHEVEDGIRILRDQGIEPRYWETPHYAGSPLAYRVFAHYFSHAVENRDPAEWVPYPSGPDEYGQTLIPETIGYINPAEGLTVDAQLQRAEQIRIVRDGWAVGFYHPASIPLPQLESLVSGLREQGYVFADLRAMPTEVRSDYQPGPLQRLTTWLTVDLVLSLWQADLWLEQEFAWWPVVKLVPWTLVAVSVLGGVFFIRLRQQWRPAKTAQLSLIESGRRTGARRPVRLAAITTGGLALLFGVWLAGFGSGSFDAISDDRLRSWSSLDWTVKYDGYGEVRAENGIASLKPQVVQRPIETSAALALAGDPGWRDYSFTAKMRLREQLRQNSAPNEWEAGWLFFRYRGEARSYYLAHKTNGLELGKLVPPAGTGQVILETQPYPPAEPGRWYDYRIDVRGAKIRVYVDGKLQLTYKDPDPILGGRVGISATEPATIVAARNQSPLVIGLGEEENFLASAVQALLDETRQFLMVENGEIVEITESSVEMFTVSGEPVERAPLEVDWDAGNIERGVFEHFMLKEIHEQPTALQATLAGRLDADGTPNLSEVRLDFSGVHRVVIVACGTAYHAGLLGKQTIERLARIPVEVAIASEYRYSNPIGDDNTLVIAISQSGETTDTLAAIQAARKFGGRVLALTNTQGSLITREADAVFLTKAGPEIGVAATKTFLAQVAALNLLALELARARTALPDREAREIGRELRRAPEKVQQALELCGERIEAAMELFEDAHCSLFLGRGSAYPVALEGALKLKEISYIPAEGYPAGEMKHGPIALVDELCPVVAILGEGLRREKTLSNVQETVARGANVIALTCDHDATVQKVARVVVPLPEVSEILEPLVASVPLQLLAYRVATDWGLNVDKPRNLAKSVTVE